MYSPERTELSVAVDIPVCIVEDNLSYRKTVEELVDGTDGMQCLYAFESCEDLFAAFPLDPLPEVLLMDIRIPGKMSGIEGVERLTEMAPDIRIVMLTLHDDDNDIFGSLCAGASGYLLKMEEPEGIIEGIREARRGGVAMTRQIAQRVLTLFRRFVPPKKDYKLTSREIEILQLLVDGLTRKQIAEELFISFPTVDTHIQHVYEKLHVHSATQAVKKAIQERLI